MTDSDEKLTEEEAHKKFAEEFFNKTWEYIEKNRLTEEDREKMVNLAHASRMHWDHVGSYLQYQRGEWMLALVYSLIGMGEPALYHAEKCLELTEKYGDINEYGFKDFDIAFGYECMARASKVAGDEEEYERYYKMAEEKGEKIEDDGNKEWFFDCLEGISEGGIKGI